MVSTAPDAWPSSTVSTAFEPSLCLRRFLFPGNGILPPETKAPKLPLESGWPFAETKRPRASPPIRGFSPKAGKSPLDQDCVVGPGGMPRQSNSNGLRLQTSVTARIERKGVFGAITNQAGALIMPGCFGFSATESSWRSPQILPPLRPGHWQTYGPQPVEVGRVAPAWELSL
jgi:hypothetical protein